MFKEVLRFMFPPRQRTAESERGLQEYMRIEQVAYHDIFPPKWRDKVDGDPRVKRGQ